MVLVIYRLFKRKLYLTAIVLDLAKKIPFLREVFHIYYNVDFEKLPGSNDSSILNEQRRTDYIFWFAYFIERNRKWENNIFRASSLK